MTKILTLIPVVVAGGLIIAVTYVQGEWSQRWSTEPEEEMSQLAARYQDIPKEFGDWVGEDLQYNPGELELAGAKANVSRRYRNKETGLVVSVYMICGYSRDVAVHTPDACYVGRGHVMERRPVSQPFNLGADVSTLKTSTFLKETGKDATHQRIFWGWNRGGRWEAPHSPRWKYGGRSILNKIYLIASVPGGSKEALEDSAAYKFGLEYLPLVSQTLYPLDPTPATETSASGTEKVAATSGP